MQFSWSLPDCYLRFLRLAAIVWLILYADASSAQTWSRIMCSPGLAGCSTNATVDYFKYSGNWTLSGDTKVDATNTKVETLGTTSSALKPPRTYGMPILDVSPTQSPILRDTYVRRDTCQYPANGVARAGGGTIYWINENGIRLEDAFSAPGEWTTSESLNPGVLGFSFEGKFQGQASAGISLGSLPYGYRGAAQQAVYATTEKCAAGGAEYGFFYDLYSGTDGATPVPYINAYISNNTNCYGAQLIRRDQLASNCSKLVPPVGPSDRKNPKNYWYHRDLPVRIFNHPGYPNDPVIGADRRFTIHFFTSGTANHLKVIVAKVGDPVGTSSLPCHIKGPANDYGPFEEKLECTYDFDLGAKAGWFPVSATTGSTQWIIPGTYMDQAYEFSGNVGFRVNKVSVMR
jgi:hypothetical protein